MVSGAAGLVFPHGLDAAPTPLAKVLVGAQGTYIGRLLTDRDSTLDRWRDRTASPIRVWIERPTASEQANGFVEAVRTAFTEWSSIGLPLRFIFASDARNADVDVRWAPQLANKTGNTVWRADRNGWMEHASIALATHFTDGRVLDPRSLHAIALHEVGHTLGLSHSENSHDVMAPLVRVATLSESDRATAQLLYSLPPGRVR